MSIPGKFMEIARAKLDPALYQEIYQRAVTLDHEQQLTGRSASEAGNPVALKRVEAHLNGERQPILEVAHVQERLERRLEIDVTKADLGDLLRLAIAGGPNVEVIRQYMDLTVEAALGWRGKHFVVIYSKSRNKLITAYPKIKQNKKKMRVGRPRDWRSIDNHEMTE